MIREVRGRSLNQRRISGTAAYRVRIPQVPGCGKVSECAQKGRCRCRKTFSIFIPWTCGVAKLLIIAIRSERCLYYRAAGQTTGEVVLPRIKLPSPTNYHIRVGWTLAPPRARRSRHLTWVLLPCSPHLN